MNHLLHIDIEPLLRLSNCYCILINYIFQISLACFNLFFLICLTCFYFFSLVLVFSSMFVTWLVSDKKIHILLWISFYEYKLIEYLFCCSLIHTQDWDNSPMFALFKICNGWEVWSMNQISKVEDSEVYCFCIPFLCFSCVIILKVEKDACLHCIFKSRLSLMRNIHLCNLFILLLFKFIYIVSSFFFFNFL